MSLLVGALSRGLRGAERGSVAAVELALVAAVVFMLAGPSTGAVPSYQERWYNQTLDHFRYVRAPKPARPSTCAASATHV